MVNFFKRFSEWQNYVHYILNGVLLSAEVYFWELYGLNWFIMLLVLIGLTFVNDSFIHLFFWYLPKRYGRWRD